MNFTFQKSLSMLKNNPQITLLFVIFLLFSGIIIPNIFYAQTKITAITFVLLLVLFTSAFLSGWFGFVKAVVTTKDDNNIEIKIENLKSGFFGSVPVYIIPMSVFIIFVGVISYGLPALASLIFGKPDAIITQIASLANDQNAIMNFLATLPKEELYHLAERSMFLVFSLTLCYLLFIYAIPATYFNKTPNPLLGIIQGIKALVKRFIPTVMLFLVILITHLFIFFFEVVSAQLGQVMMFIALVLRVCFIVYTVVLIFSVYEENFNHNRSDSLGEN